LKNPNILDWVDSKKIVFFASKRNDQPVQLAGTSEISNMTSNVASVCEQKSPDNILIPPYKDQEEYEGRNIRKSIWIYCGAPIFSIIFVLYNIELLGVKWK
jgi:hypothetical protein